MTDIQKVVNYYYKLKGWDNMPEEFYKKKNIRYGRFCRPAKELLEFFNYDVDKVKNLLEETADFYNGRGLNYSMETAIKYWTQHKS